MTFFPVRSVNLRRRYVHARVSASSFATSAADSPAAVDDAIEHIVFVGQAGEHDLIGAGRQGHAASQHGVEETRVHTVGGQRVRGHVVDRRTAIGSLGGEKESDQRADHGNASPPGRPPRWPRRGSPQTMRPAEPSSA